MLDVRYSKNGVAISDFRCRDTALRILKESKETYKEYGVDTIITVSTENFIYKLLDLVQRKKILNTDFKFTHNGKIMLSDDLGYLDNKVDGFMNYYSNIISRFY